MKIVEYIYVRFDMLYKIYLMVETNTKKHNNTHAVIVFNGNSNVIVSLVPVKKDNIV